MPYYRTAGDIPKKRHTQFRKPDGSLYHEELMGEEGFFDDKVDRSIGTMRLNYYPGQAAPPEPGQLRASAHTDYGGFTILSGEDVPGGLQVRTRDQRWIEVPTSPTTFVVNIGDLLMRWTNDRWLSNLHRVVNPPATGAASSMPFPAADAEEEVEAPAAGAGAPLTEPGPATDPAADAAAPTATSSAGTSIAAGSR